MARNSLLVLQLLEELGAGVPLGLSQLSIATGAPKTSAHRALADLVDQGWVRESGEQPPKYFLSSKVLRVSQGAQGMAELATIAAPVLESILEATNENVQLSVMEDEFLVAIKRRESSHTLRVHVPLGQRIHWHATAAGRAIAGHLPPERLDSLLAGPLPALTENTTTDRDHLRSQIQRGLKDGYVISSDGWRTGITAVGAAILDRRGNPVAGLSVNAVDTRMTAEVMEQVSRLVLEGAAEISAQLH